MYVCRSGENEELRYSIRSVLYFYPNANIHIFGGKPSWYVGNYTEVKDIGNKFSNINACYQAICDTDVKDFILMNDDFFILEKPNSIEHYYDGSLQNKIDNHMKQNGLSKYARVLIDANKELKKMGIKEPLNYDVHIPMAFNKDKLASILSLSFAPRSMYGNIFGVGGIKMDDVKIYKKIDKLGQFSSTLDGKSFDLLLNHTLKHRFVIPTKHES